MALHQNMTTRGLDNMAVANELEHIALALLGVNEYPLSGETLRVDPVLVDKSAGELARLLAPLVVLPALAEVSDRKVEKGSSAAGVDVLRLEFHSLRVLLQRFLV